MARPDVTTRWVARGRRLGARAEAARSRHPIIDVGFSLVEHDSSIGGGLLAGALAYRLFVLLLPTSLLLVSGLGLYAGAVDESPSTVALRCPDHPPIRGGRWNAAATRDRPTRHRAPRGSASAFRSGGCAPGV